MFLQQKIFSLIISNNGISVSEIQQKLNIKAQTIYSAITNLRKKSIKLVLKNKKYYINDDKILSQSKCDNIFCLHNITNIQHALSEWNKTDCEIDPFYEENLEGFKIQECPGLKKYKKFGW